MCQALNPMLTVFPAGNQFNCSLLRSLIPLPSQSVSCSMPSISTSLVSTVISSPPLGQRGECSACASVATSNPCRLSLPEILGGQALDNTPATPIRRPHQRIEHLHRRNRHL